MTWNDGTPYVDELVEGVYAYVQPDGGWMVNNCGVIVDGSGTAVLVDTMSTERRNRALLDEVAQVSTRRPEGGREHPPPPGPHLRQRLPARRDAGDRPREVPRRGARRRPRGHQGDHRARLRRPHPAPAGDHLQRPDDAAPRGVPGRAPPRRRPGAHDQRRPGLAARAAGAVRRRPGLQRRSAVRPRGVDRRLPHAPSRRCRRSRPRCWRPGHGPVCRGDDVGTLLDAMDDYLGFVAATSPPSRTPPA